MNITLKDFYPINSWRKIEAEGDARFSGRYGSLVDLSTGRRYRYCDSKDLRKTCAILTSVSLLWHLPVISILTIYRVLRVCSLSHLWVPNAYTDSPKTYHLKSRLLESGKDLLMIVGTPLAFILLVFFCLYGIVRPYDGMKLYASLERLWHDNFFSMPDFQPLEEVEMIPLNSSSPV